MKRLKIPKKETPKEKREQERAKRREYHLKRLYGITNDQYQELLEKQDHKCFVCQKHETEFKTKLAVDHNHKTGEIRGLLCNYCNHRIVGRNTDPEIMRRVYEYLSQGTGWIVPSRPKKKRRVRKKVVKGKAKGVKK